MRISALVIFASALFNNLVFADESFYIADPQQISVEAKNLGGFAVRKSNVNFLIDSKIFGSESFSDFGLSDRYSSIEADYKKKYFDAVIDLAKKDGSKIKVIKNTSNNSLWLEPANESTREKAMAMFRWDLNPNSAIESINPSLLSIFDRCNYSFAGISTYEIEIRAMYIPYRTLKFKDSASCVAFLENLNNQIHSANKDNLNVSLTNGPKGTTLMNILKSNSNSFVNETNVRTQSGSAPKQTSKGHKLD